MSVRPVRRVELTTRAVQDLDRLERAQPGVFGKVVAKIRSLEADPTAGKPLVGPLKGKWSLRVGDYRIIYETPRSRIVVLTITHRKDVYR